MLVFVRAIEGAQLMISHTGSASNNYVVLCNHVVITLIMICDDESSTSSWWKGRSRRGRMIYNGNIQLLHPLYEGYKAL